MDRKGVSHAVLEFHGDAYANVAGAESHHAVLSASRYDDYMSSISSCCRLMFSHIHHGEHLSPIYISSAIRFLFPNEHCIRRPLVPPSLPKLNPSPSPHPLFPYYIRLPLFPTSLPLPPIPSHPIPSQASSGARSSSTTARRSPKRRLRGSTSSMRGRYSCTRNVGQMQGNNCHRKTSSS